MADIYEILSSDDRLVAETDTENAAKFAARYLLAEGEDGPLRIRNATTGELIGVAELTEVGIMYVPETSDREKRFRQAQRDHERECAEGGER